MQKPKVVLQPRKRSVVPMNPSDPVVHPVSRLDSIMGNFYLQTVYLFDRPSSSLVLSREMLVEEFNCSLSLVLNRYPVVSGRLRALQDGNLGIKHNDAGVRMFEGTVDAGLKEWVQAGDRSSSHQQLYPPEIRISDYSVSPLVAVQYTHFRCGGIAIGISWCHILADLLSMTVFMKLWGEAHRHLAEFSVSPSFSLQNPSQLQIPVLGFGPEEEIAIESSDLEAQVFHLSSKMVERCMQEAKQAEKEALCALLWKSIVKAQGVPESEISRFSLWMDRREKEHAAAPAGYFGNSAVIFEFVDAEAGELLEKSVDHVARIIHEEKRLQPNKGSFFAQNVVLCNWAASSPCYDVDFGFRRPVLVECSALSMFGEGIVTVMPGSEGGRSKTVSISLRPEAMKRFAQDSWFQIPPQKQLESITGAPAA